jgi:hypothetical protein
MNERTYSIITADADTNSYYKGHTLRTIYGASDWASAGRIWGYSYSRMNPV